MEEDDNWQYSDDHKEEACHSIDDKKEQGLYRESRKLRIRGLIQIHSFYHRNTSEEADWDRVDKDLRDMLEGMCDDHNQVIFRRFDHKNRKEHLMYHKEHLVLLLHKNTSDELTLYKEDKDRNGTSPYRDDGHRQGV